MNNDIQKIEDVINKSPSEVKERLIKLRELIKKEAPDVTEKLGYGVPAFYLNGPLIYYSPFKNHIGFYPANGDIFKEFESKLKMFETSKGTIKFPHNKEMPWELITDIIKFRVKQQLAKK